MFTSNNKKVPDAVRMHIDMAVSHYLDAYLALLEATFSEGNNPSDEEMRDLYFEVAMLWGVKLDEEINTRKMDP